MGFTKKSLTEVAFALGRDNFASMYSDLRVPITSMLQGIAGVAPEKAADAQRRALERSLAPSIRVEVLRAFVWHVVSSNEPLVLPDCVAVGLDESGQVPLALADKETLSGVFMPLGPHLMLVGSRETRARLDHPNECFAGCSWDFFVAHEKADEFERLRTELRSQIGPHLEGTIRAAVAEAIEGEA